MHSPGPFRPPSQGASQVLRYENSAKTAGFSGSVEGRQQASANYAGRVPAIQRRIPFLKSICSSIGRSAACPQLCPHPANRKFTTPLSVSLVICGRPSLHENSDRDRRYLHRVTSLNMTLSSSEIHESNQHSILSAVRFLT